MIKELIEEYRAELLKIWSDRSMGFGTCYAKEKSLKRVYRIKMIIAIRQDLGNDFGQSFWDIVKLEENT